MKKTFYVLLLLFGSLLTLAACQTDASVIEDESPNVNPATTLPPSPTPTQLPPRPEISTPPDDEANFPDIFDLQFSDLVDLEFWFGSGAGAWCTTVNILSDGTFTGYFHDSDMGDGSAEYPNGTVYECSFSGKFTSLEKTGEYEYSMKCELLTWEGTIGEEKIVDGVRVITSEPYGFDNADEFFLYLPGKETSGLPEEFLQWVSMPRALDFESIDVLEFYGLYNVRGEQGFSA